MTEEQAKYKSYLLRLWQTDSKGQQVWQASLEHPGSGERRGFANLEALFEFLKAQTSPETISFTLRAGAEAFPGTATQDRRAGDNKTD
jgi:hypothetical protein